VQDSFPSGHRPSSGRGGIVCYVAVQWKNKMHWDDALDVWGVHGVGGVLGTILLGVFASIKVNAGVPMACGSAAPASS